MTSIPTFDQHIPEGYYPAIIDDWEKDVQEGDLVIRNDNYAKILGQDGSAFPCILLKKEIGPTTRKPGMYSDGSVILSSDKQIKITLLEYTGQVVNSVWNPRISDWGQKWLKLKEWKETP